MSTRGSVLLAACLLLSATGPARAADSGTLTCPTKVASGSPFLVRWSGTAMPNDFISIDTPGDAPANYGSHYGSPANANPVRLVAPETPGNYVVRYHLAAGYTAIASAPLEVTPVTATLDAPASVDAGGSVSVRWNGPNNAGDFVSIDKPGTPDRQYGPYAYPSAGNPLTIRAPDESGDYEVRYHQGGEYTVIGRAALHIGTVGASLAAPDTVSAGAKLEVHWVGPNEPRDFISLDAVGAAETSYGHYAYSADGNPLHIVVPDTAGDYVLRYHTGQSYKVLASRPVTVLAAAASLTAADTVSAGATLEVKWSGPNEARDYVSVDAVGAPEADYGPYRYTTDGNPVRIVVPDTAGDYVLRYHTGQSNKVLATRAVKVAPVTASLSAPAQVVVGHVFEVRWEGPNNDGDFVTLVPVGTEAKTYGANNAYPKRGNPVRIEAAREAGQYEIRYLTGQSYNTLARAPVQIAPDMTAGHLRVVSAPGAASPLAFGAIELVLDASGSMLQRIHGERRIELAKRAFTDLTKEIPAGSGFAMRVFGNKEADSCRTDLEIPLAPLDVGTAVARIRTIESKNLAKTPIGASLAKVPADLAGATGKLLVVLVTDGEETCGGDPKAAIESLRKAGLDVHVNIVGFAVDEVGLKETFQAWARAGNGSYFDAHDGAELSAAVRATLRSMFEVMEGGRVVASGVVDGESIEVPAGTYRVRVPGTLREAEDVVVAPAATRDLAL